MAVTTPGVSALTEGQPAPPRRAPSQHRSRERVERMLAAATDLIAEKGSDAMRMGEVAEKAGVSIGSLYQYFPDKGAIIRMLAERYNARGRECIEAELANVRDMADLRDAFTRLVDAYYAMFLAEPVMRDIWSGTQADKALRNIDLADSRSSARRSREAAFGRELAVPSLFCGGEQMVLSPRGVRPRSRGSWSKFSR